MDLVRAILLALEEHEHGHAPRKLAIDGYSEEQVGYHVHLMGEPGLLRTVDTTCMGSSSPSAIALGMTWEGYEFLEAARQPSTWQKAKDRITRSGAALSFEVLKGVLVAMSKEFLGLNGKP